MKDGYYWYRDTQKEEFIVIKVVDDEYAWFYPQEMCDCDSVDYLTGELLYIEPPVES